MCTCRWVRCGRGGTVRFTLVLVIIVAQSLTLKCSFSFFSDFLIKVVDLVDVGILLILEGHQAPVLSLQFSGENLLVKIIIIISIIQPMRERERKCVCVCVCIMRQKLYCSITSLSIYLSVVFVLISSAGFF